MIHLYDANNVMLRAMTVAAVPGQTRLSMRQRLAAANATSIWVWDGINHNDRRKAHYPPYKGQRLPLAQDLFSQIKLFKELLVHTAAVQVNVPGWEADDCIATIAKRHPGPVTIHTNDADYLQLAVLPNVTLNGVKRGDIEPRWTCLYKALVGDPSDNITGIPGFGPKAWEATDGHRPQIVEAIVKGNYLGLADAPGFSKRHLEWLQINMEWLQGMFLITHMWDVSEDELNAGITTGTPNPEAIDLTLRKYFL
jgi:hypothetical protein